MTNTPDDLSGLFGPAPAGPSQDVKYRDGIIRTFNPITWQNTVEVGSTLMHDLPLLGVGEASLLVPDSKVGIMVVGDSAQTMFILGRNVEPNTEDQRSASALLNSQVFTDFVTSPGGDPCTSSTYTDLATHGPEVRVPVGANGRLLVIATAQVQWGSTAASPTKGTGAFDVAFTEANVRVPDELVDPLVGVVSLDLNTSAGTIQQAAIFAVTTQAVFSGLNAGFTTVTMKYRRSATGYASDPTFFRRTLTVIKL